MAGNHYWSSHCPRYHAFAKHEASPEVSDNSCRASDSSRASTSSRDASPSPSDCNLSLKQTAMRTLRYPSPAKVEAAHSTLSLAGTSAWPEPDRSVILQPCSYISTMPSKGVRSQLIDALNDWFHVPKASLDTITEIIRQLHDASLILDDIEDNSPLRRRKPAVHSIYGHSQAINSANYMFVRAVQASRQLRSSAATDILLEDLDGLYVGQSLDLNWKFTLHCPTEEEYLTMIDHKTGGMFRMLLRLMQAESRYHAKVDFGRLPLLFGRFFQIRDDYMNLESQDYADQKGFCEDFDEGKLSYPVVYCIQRSPQARSQILGIFRQRPTGLGAQVQSLPMETKAHILDCLKSAGALDASLQYVNQLEEELDAAIVQLESAIRETNPMLRLLVKRLSLKKDPAREEQ